MVLNFFWVRKRFTVFTVWESHGGVQNRKLFETSITIPAENSSTTNNNNGKFKNYFISHFGELSWKFQAQVKTIEKISKLPSVIKFFCSYYTCCCASWCQLLSGSWFSESLLDFFLELINSSERIPHYFFCIVPLNIKICFNKSTQILIFFNEKIRNQCESIRIVLNPDQSSTSARGPRGRRGWNSRESEFERKPATNERWVELLTDFE